ncbi:MAG: hypothetical protein AB1750_17290, partial [Chloroflexota bacterium]
MPTAAKKPVATPRPPLTYRVTLRDAADAVTRLRVDHKGARYVNRFSTAVAIEHFVFMLAVIVLGVTGFAQTYYDSALGSAALVLFGGIDAVRVTHHAFAFILGFTALYHVLRYLNDAIVYRRRGEVWFDKADWARLFRLGAARKPARFGRYTFAEKV